MDMVIVNRPRYFQDDQDLELEVIGRPMVVPEHPEYRPIKRALDLLICVLALPVFLPLLALCAAAIRFDSSGPIFFIQERVGKGGRRFKMIKFRTMHTQVDDQHHRDYLKAYVKGQVAETQGQAYKPKARVTRVGRFLRKASLDELPQLFNVLKGEMSIIGPRPNLAWEVEEYQFWHHERLEVLPGITGLAQVRGRSSLSFEQIVNFDAEYVAQMSLVLDLKILWWTAMVVLRGAGAH